MYVGVYVCTAAGVSMIRASCQPVCVKLCVYSYAYEGKISLI